MDRILLQSYRHCQGIARRRARNFYYGFRLLPPDRQRAICAVYAFMRFCDDIADEPESPTTKEGMLDHWQDALEDALNGNYHGNRILPALHHAVTEFRIPPDYFRALIDGARMDLHVSRYDTFEDLYTYCYRVASVVGLVCIHIFGYESQEAIRYAEHTGIAFQLTNILRDIREDAGMGRIYLPQEDLRAFGYPEEHLIAGVYDDPFVELMRYEVTRARSYYRSAPLLVPLVRPISRGGLAAMVHIYQGILNKIEQKDYDVLTNRVELSLREKLQLASRGWLEYQFQGGREPSNV